MTAITYPPPPVGPPSLNQDNWIHWFVLLSPAQRNAFLRDGYYSQETMDAIDACFGQHSEWVRRCRFSLQSTGASAEDFARAGVPRLRCELEHTPSLRIGGDFGDDPCPVCPPTSWRRRGGNQLPAGPDGLATSNSGWYRNGRNAVSGAPAILPRSQRHESLADMARGIVLGRVARQESVEEIAQRLSTESGALYQVDEERAALGMTSSSVPRTRSTMPAPLTNRRGRRMAIVDLDASSTTAAATDVFMEDDVADLPRAIPQPAPRSRRDSHNGQTRRLQLVEELLRSVPPSWTPQTVDRVQIDDEGLPALIQNDGNLIHHMRRQVATDVQQILHG